MLLDRWTASVCLLMAAALLAGCGQTWDIYVLEAGFPSPVLQVQSLCVLGLLTGLAIWFIVLWIMNPFDVTSICIAATGILVALHEIAAPHFTHPNLSLFDSAELRTRVELASFFLTGAFCLLFLWALYPRDVYPFRIGSLVVTPLLGRLTSREWSLPDGDVLTGDEPTDQVRQLHTAILLAPVLIAVGFAGASAVVPETSLVVLKDLSEALIFPLALAVPVFLAHLVRMKRPFARTIAGLYGIVLLAGSHDVLLHMDAITGIPVFSVAFLGFLMGIGWLDLSHLRFRWSRALDRCHGTEIELRNQIEQLRSMCQTAESVARTQTQYVASISHELRSPLTSILGFTELLEDELHERLAPSHRGFIQSIRDGAGRLLLLVNDLLDLSRSEEGALGLCFGRVDVDEVLDDAIRNHYPLAEAKKLALTVEKEYLGATVWADPMRLRQIVTNLLSNAVKFTDEGRIIVRIRRDTLPISGTVRPAVAIDVDDTGQGISPAF
ncbi:MAG: HAMP domain-containing sensor histidine kinase, partial [Rhodothermales bacterium]